MIQNKKNKMIRKEERKCRRIEIKNRINKERKKKRKKKTQKGDE